MVSFDAIHAGKGSRPPRPGPRLQAIGAPGGVAPPRPCPVIMSASSARLARHDNPQADRASYLWDRTLAGQTASELGQPGRNRRRGKWSLTIHAYTCIVCSEVTAMKLLSLPCYCATLRLATRSVTALYETVLADSGLHPTQYTALEVLSRVPNSTTTELADAIGINQTTATRTLALIKKAHLIVNAPGGDRRERRWVL